MDCTNFAISEIDMVVHEIFIEANVALSKHFTSLRIYIYIYIYIYTYTTGKKYGTFFISATFYIFMGCTGCFCTGNTFLRADITFGGAS